MRRQDHLQTDLLQITVRVNRGKAFNNTTNREEVENVKVHVNSNK